MHVEIISVLSDNFAYLITCTQTNQAVVIDPADPDVVLDRVRQRGVDLRAIWNTHHHWDHTAGNDKVLKGRALHVVGHASDKGRIPGFTQGVDDGDKVFVGELEAEILYTPGHTTGGICYLIAGCLFTGDALFGGGCGRLFEGDAAMMHASLNTRLANVPDATKIYFGHEYTQKNLAFAAQFEPNNTALTERIRETAALREAAQPSVPSTWLLEKQTNPFLRCDSAEIRRCLAQRDPDAELETPEQTFRLLRHLRDSF